MGTVNKDEVCQLCVETPGLKDANTLCPGCNGTPSKSERERLAKEAAASTDEAPSEPKEASKPKTSAPKKPTTSDDAPKATDDAKKPDTTPAA